MKKYAWKVVLATVLTVLLVGMLASCEKINAFLHGDTGSGKAPEITAVYTEKAVDGWYESKEYLFNKDCTNPMALNDGEKYYIVLEYENPGKLGISSVKINNVKYDRSAFVEGSTSEKTKILFQVDERAETETLTYAVNNVMYSDGSATAKMKWAANVSNEVQVSVRPFFQLKLNDMNTDFRAEKYSSLTASTERVASSAAYYGTKMSAFQVYAPDYTKNSSTIKKDGGWVFAGWFTQPDGQGLNITDSDQYFFWCNMTLYAHFERMYEIETVDLPETLEYNYSTNGIIRFTRGAVITRRDDFSRNDSPTHNPVLEIPNTVTIETIHTTEETGEFGIPVYTVSVARTELPVVKIDNNAFDGFNTMESASIGRFVEEIGYAAFRECTKLSTVSFFEKEDNSSLKYIGDYAFRETTSLGADSSFNLPAKVEYIGNLAFRNSGWAKVRQGSENKSTLTVKKEWKYIGTEAFMGTGFKEVVFEAGCHFDDQINETEGKAIESAEGFRERQQGNLIGSYLFAACVKLETVEFRADAGENNALNIIPDRCFDIFNYRKDKDEVTMLSNVYFSEGLEYIGQKAFYYQEKIPSLAFPASLEEVDIDAFYQNVSVTTLTFAEGSQLRALHNSSFGNLTKVDSVTINSAVFEKYGSGVFRGCDKMKCVIFSELTEVPRGYLKGAVDERHKNDVIVGHKQADFLYATGEAGEKKMIDGEEVNADDENDEAKTYSSPMRIFCRKEILEDFKEEMKNGKEMEAGSHSTGTSAFSSAVFVHPLENIRTYTYTGANGDPVTVQVAVQEVYKVSERTMTNTVLGYSLVYWSDRNSYIRLPTADDLNLQNNIIELAYYALPTSVTTVYIPSCYVRLDHDAFNNCTALTNVVFEDINTLEYIGDYAFFGTSIRSFVGGTSLKVIGQYAFNRCMSLKWVDLRDCPIKNTLKGRTKLRTQCKYAYEVKDDEKDYADMLGYGAFKGCHALSWVYLPQVQQIMTATFTNCKQLATVFLPTPNAYINRDTSATNDNAFYEYGQYNTVFDPSISFKLDIYINSDALDAHRTIWDRTGGKDYNIISESNSERPEN